MNTTTQKFCRSYCNIEVKKLKIGYIRVSTAEQNTIRQEVLMCELTVDELFIVARWQSGEISAAEAMRRTGLKPNTFYRRVSVLHTKNA